MEIKKSKGADLESTRTTRFLLGMILVLSCFFVALEYSSDDSSSDIDTDSLKDMHRDEDEDLIPLVTRKDLLMPVPERQVQAADVLKVVDEVPDMPMPDDIGSDAKDDEKQLPDIPEPVPDEDVAEEPVPPILNADDDPLSLRIVEDLPEFPGGAVEFMKWLTENLRYPEAARRGRVQGRVVAQFVVNADGSISDIKIVTSLDPVCDREAMRVLAMMPKWKAGSQYGKPCRTIVAIPIVFKL